VPKPFELAYLAAQPFLPYLRVRAREEIKALARTCAKSTGNQIRLLDVGARKSHYTIGVGAQVTLLDLPRVTEQQSLLSLGVTDKVMSQIRARRTNIAEYIVSDFLEADLPEQSYDLVTGIEVIEHVRRDHEFIEKAFRLLKPAGALFLTTPNGQAIPNRNPDHCRHYDREQLLALLASAFPTAVVWHGEIMTASWQRGMRFRRGRSPVHIACAMMANLINHMENALIPATPANSARLFAVARKGL